MVEVTYSKADGGGEAGGSTKLGGTWGRHLLYLQWPPSHPMLPDLLGFFFSPRETGNKYFCMNLSQSYNDENQFI